MSDLRSVLTETVLARSKWKRKQCGYPELEKKRAAWIDQYAQVFVGYSSISVPETETKLITFDEWPVTSGELARAYLRLVYEGAKVRPPNPRARGFAWQAPIHVAPVRHRAMAYIDIESAYWQLISCFRPDDLILGDEIVPGTTQWLTTDVVNEDRRLRHAIHGSVFANHLSFYRYGSVVTIPKVNAWSNPTMKCHCMQVLHAVAGRLARDANLHAWLTDAAIVDADDAEPITRYFARDWALRARCKALGSGTVISSTSYVVGDKASLDIVHKNTTPLLAEPAAISKIRRVPAAQVQRIRRMVA